MSICSDFEIPEEIDQPCSSLSSPSSSSSSSSSSRSNDIQDFTAEIENREIDFVNDDHEQTFDLDITVLDNSRSFWIDIAFVIMFLAYAFVIMPILHSFYSGLSPPVKEEL